MEIKFTSADYLIVIDKFPHSKSRVPYTYHHDYLRQKCHLFSGLSRSDVATKHECNYDELHAFALVQILSDLGENSFIYISSFKDIIIIKQALIIVRNKINFYNDKLIKT